MALRSSRAVRSGGGALAFAILLAAAGCAGSGRAGRADLSPALKMLTPANGEPSAGGSGAPSAEPRATGRAAKKAAERQAREEAAARKAAEQTAKREAAQAAPAEDSPPPEPGAPVARSGDYLLQPGDEIDVQIYREPELSGAFKINPAGDIRHSLLGPVPTAGKTVDEAEADFTRRLAKDYLVQPRVIVKLVSTQSSQIVLLGEVKKPGVYPLAYGESRTLLQAIAEAGGFTELASPERIRIVRRTADGGQTTRRVRMSDLLRGKGGERDVPLEPNDVIMVDQVLF